MTIATLWFWAGALCALGTSCRHRLNNERPQLQEGVAKVGEEDAVTYELRVKRSGVSNPNMSHDTLVVHIPTHELTPLVDTLLATKKQSEVSALMNKAFSCRSEETGCKKYKDKFSKDGGFIKETLKPGKILFFSMIYGLHHQKDLEKVYKNDPKVLDRQETLVKGADIEVLSFASAEKIKDAQEALKQKRQKLAQWLRKSLGSLTPEGE